MLERYLPGVHGRLKQLPNAPAADSKSVVPRRTHAYRRSRAEEIATQESRAKWLALYKEVKRRYNDGKNISAISRELDLNIKTVRKYAHADAFPERSKHPGPSVLDPYLGYLNTRHREGCENASQLWREIKQQGFRGSKGRVIKWMREQRLMPAPTTPGQYVEKVREEKRKAVRKTKSTPELPSAKQLAWLFIQEPSTLQKADVQTLTRVRQDVEAAHVYNLARTFVDMVRQKRPEQFDVWLEACAESGVKALRTFAAGIRQDHEAVRSALELPWSNGQTEG